MKYQKVVTLIILLLSATFAFTSCNDDGYSLDKFWLEVGTNPGSISQQKYT